MPNPQLTPGAVATSDTAVICHRSTQTVRHTSQALKDSIYAEYHIRRHRPGQYEIDHSVPLELGGADVRANLWAQPARPRPGFHEKDQLENKLHQLVCSGRLNIRVAQNAIATDWWSAYRRYITKP